MSHVKRLTIVLLLNLSLITALVIVGLAAHSLAVLAAGAADLADAGAIGVSLLAVWLASSRPPSRARPHGYPNATDIAALQNARVAARTEHRDRRGRDPAPGRRHPPGRGPPHPWRCIAAVSCWPGRSSSTATPAAATTARKT